MTPEDTQTAPTQRIARIEALEDALDNRTARVKELEAFVMKVAKIFEGRSLGDDALATLSQPAPSRETDWGPDVGNEILPPPPSAWRPIETAPKDGTPILVTNGKKHAAVYWWPMVWMGTTNNGMKEPTHWMPLPPPPEKGE
jgi:hypothetical protein